MLVNMDSKRYIRFVVCGLIVLLFTLTSCTSSHSDESSDWESLVQGGWVIITAVAAFFVLVYREIDRQTTKYQKCARDLQSKNETVQVTAAILLRNFLEIKWYSFARLFRDDCKKLLIALLKTMSNSHLQKTLADSISFFDNANGMDFQKVNLYNASIKPEYRKKYELTDDPKYIDKHIDMKCADFYRSLITSANINNVNFHKSVFLETVFVDSRFHHCDFREANFGGADLKLVRFDNCNLKGAILKGALHLDSVKYEVGVKDTPGYKCYEGEDFVRLIDMKGIFQGVDQKNCYQLPSKKNTIFISKLGVMDTQQVERYNRVMDYLIRYYSIEIEKIDRDDYRDTLQLDDIISKMNHCDGVIIFAFSYMTVLNGAIHEHVAGEDNVSITDKEYTSPWLQIEAALARGQNKPCLIIHTPEIVKDGMFDEKILESDDHIYPIAYDEPFQQHKQVIEDWYREVEKAC